MCMQQPVPPPLFQKIMEEKEKSAQALEDAVDSLLSDWRAIQETCQE